MMGNSLLLRTTALLLDNANQFLEEFSFSLNSNLFLFLVLFYKNILIFGKIFQIKKIFFKIAFFRI